MERVRTGVDATGYRILEKRVHVPNRLLAGIRRGSLVAEFIEELHNGRLVELFELAVAENRLDVRSCPQVMLH